MNRQLKLIIITDVLIVAVASAGFYFWQKAENKESQKPEWRQVVQYNCEQTGGSFIDNNCECPKGALPDMYEKTSGYCTTDMGTTGGKIGEMSAENFNCKMELDQLKKDKK